MISYKSPPVTSEIYPARVLVVPVAEKYATRIPDPASSVPVSSVSSPAFFVTEVFSLSFCKRSVCCAALLVPCEEAGTDMPVSGELPWLLQAVVTNTMEQAQINDNIFFILKSSSLKYLFEYGCRIYLCVF